MELAPWSGTSGLPQGQRERLHPRPAPLDLLLREHALRELALPELLRLELVVLDLVLRNRPELPRLRPALPHPVILAPSLSRMAAGPDQCLRRGPNRSPQAVLMRRLLLAERRFLRPLLRELPLLELRLQMTAFS